VTGAGAGGGAAPASGDAEEARAVGGRGAVGTLVVGYGNELRSDDGLGRYAAARLAEDPRLRGATVLSRHQLTPELAVDVSEASLVILVDASSADEAGAISVRRVEPVPEAGSAWSHHLDPAGLAALALELWGASPVVFAVSVGTASVDLGERLSSTVERSLPGVVDAVAAIVAEHGHA